MSEQIQQGVGGDPSALAHEMSLQLAAKAEEQREKHRRKLAKAAKAKADADLGTVLLEDENGQLRPVVPMTAFLNVARGDFAKIPDELIKTDPVYGKYCTHWVRHLDNFGEPSDTEIEERKRFGYEVILKPDGQPLKRRELTAVQAPPQCLAAWMVANSIPGSLVRERASEPLYEAARQDNKEAGRRVVSIVTDERDGPMDPEEVDFGR